ncbi:large neutral amino acids transporter small subunit 4-like [Bombina bombina]|uniref:large neutral amino acids transporter small subunit 4-like n=1 Tax=Bombina bombina TaxID=8345 RepID=UPI00235A8F72|nr:large neutral amino acids transporter small subunit 4-like [Bombina bombina]
MGQKWKYWMLGSALVETFLFSGCLLGWNSLNPILSQLGVLSGHCPADQKVPETWSNDSTGLLSHPTMVPTDPGSLPRKPLIICIPQERALNIGFTLGCLFLGGTFLPLQLVVASVYLRSLRQIGGALVAVSCLMVVYSCTNPRGLSLFLPASLLFMGVGGCCVLFTSLMLPLSLGIASKSLYSSLVIGCFSASATVFTLIKALYIVGVPFVPLILGLGAMACLMFLNSFFSWHLNRTENKAETMYSVQLRINCCEHKQEEPEKQELWQRSLRHQFRESLRDRERILSSRKVLSFRQKQGSGSEAPPLRRSLLRPLFVLHLFSDAVLLTWLHFYISSLNQHLRSVTDDQQRADQFSSIFGSLQMLSLISAPLVALHRNQQIIKRERKRGEADSGCVSQRLSLALILRILAVCGFGVSCLIPSLGVQVLGFIIHVIVRSSSFILSTELFNYFFPATHFGALLGIYTVITSMLTVSQYPLFLLLTGTLNGDPYWIHATFLGLSSCAVPVPLYLWIQRTKKNHHKPIVLRRANPSNKTHQLTKV